MVGASVSLGCRVNFESVVELEWENESVWCGDGLCSASLLGSVVHFDSKRFHLR